MEVIEKGQDEVCLLPKPRDIVFPEMRENKDMHLLCNKLKGTMSVTDNQDTQNRLVEEFTKKMPDEYSAVSKLNTLIMMTVGQPLWDDIKFVEIKFVCFYLRLRKSINKWHTISTLVWGRWFWTIPFSGQVPNLG